MKNKTARKAVKALQKGEIGTRGEEAAARFLEQHGLHIKARNYHAACGEIDVIAENERYLVFAEVKTRTPRMLGTPAQAVDAKKQMHIVKTAVTWLLLHPSPLQPRFDVVEVTLQEDGTVLACNHYENAFDAPNRYACM